jgi:hypothetical protein
VRQAFLDGRCITIDRPHANTENAATHPATLSLFVVKSASAIRIPSPAFPTDQNGLTSTSIHPDPRDDAFVFMIG